MNAISRNAIRDSITQNFSSYPEDYQNEGGDITEDSVGQLVRWVEGEFANEDDEGTIEEWFEIATEEYLTYFDLTEEYEKNWDTVEEFIEKLRTKPFTFDIYFNDDYDSNNKGFRYTYEEAKAYIDTYNGTDESYFEDYKGGVVSIVNNETEETVYEVEIPAMTSSMRTGKKIEHRRKEQGHSQTMLGDMVGTSQVHISRIESGLISPSFDLIISIANALECSTDDFI